MSFGLPPFSGGIGAFFKILEILEYACYRSDCYAVGFKLGPASNLVRLRRIEPTRQRRV